jgi:hypothetical protein
MGTTTPERAPLPLPLPLIEWVLAALAAAVFEPAAIAALLCRAFAVAVPLLVFFSAASRSASWRASTFLFCESQYSY